MQNISDHKFHNCINYSMLYRIAEYIIMVQHRNVLLNVNDMISLICHLEILVR